MSPVNYLKLDHVPKVDDMSSDYRCDEAGRLLCDLGRGADFLLRRRGIGESARSRPTWNGPFRSTSLNRLGDGLKTGRQIISTTDLPTFGTKRFQIPFDAAGKKWVRFAAWDTAGNGALVQPIKLPGAVLPPATR